MYLEELLACVRMCLRSDIYHVQIYIITVTLCTLLWRVFYKIAEKSRTVGSRINDFYPVGMMTLWRVAYFIISKTTTANNIPRYTVRTDISRFVHNIYNFSSCPYNTRLYVLRTDIFPFVIAIIFVIKPPPHITSISVWRANIILNFKIDITYMCTECFLPICTIWIGYWAFNLFPFYPQLAFV